MISAAKPRPSVTQPQWRDAVLGAATEIAQHALAMTGARFAASEHVATGALVGAHIPLVGGERPYELQLVGALETCQALARSILMMGPTDAIKPAEVADAVGEIVNMLAGGVKRRLGAGGSELELGLPVFVNGTTVPTGKQSVVTFPLVLGTHDVTVVIVGVK